MLLTVTVNGVPPELGTTCAGETTQFGGAPVAHARSTALLYPFTVVIVPVKAAWEFTWAERVVSVRPIVKSGTAAIVIERVWVLVAAPGVDAFRVICVVPSEAVEEAVTTKVVDVGLPATGLTEAGWN